LRLEGWDKSPASRLCYYRELRDMSRSRLSELSGVPAGEIQNYEAGKQEIYYPVAEQFSMALGVDISILLDEYTRFTAPGFGKRIKKIRESTGLSQKAFAERLGINRGTVAIWEIELHRPSRQNYAIIKSIQIGGTV